MSKKKYEYHFPQNKTYKMGLNSEDIAVIACNTDYTEGTIKQMLNGHRKLANSVKEECLKIAQINASKKK